MSRFFLVGWALIAGAVYLGGLEIAFRRQATDEGLIVSAEALWHGFAPSAFASLRAWIAGSVAPWFWRDVAAPLLALPAWLLLGVPGGFISWAFHPRADADAAELEESVFTADRLAEAARRDGYGADDEPPAEIAFAPADDEPGPALIEGEPHGAALESGLAEGETDGEPRPMLPNRRG